MNIMTYIENKFLDTKTLNDTYLAGKPIPLQYATSFFTEKTWKVLLSGIPFIIFSTPYSLNDLKKLGFKTYTPFINESYDLIEDNNLRLLAIVEEIYRISTLSDVDFEQLLQNCSDIAEFNAKLVNSMKYSMKLSTEFNFLNQLLA